MMKKGMVKFFATAMTVFTLMGATVAFAPATQVFAAETTVSPETSDSTRELKKMSVKEAEAYVKGLVGNASPIQEYENTKVYKVGNHVYSFSTFEQEAMSINKSINDYDEAMKFYSECMKNGMYDNKFIKYYDTDLEGDDYFSHAIILGKIPMVNLSISTYTIKPVESIKITANKTMIRPGECAYLKLHVNEGADESYVSWRVVGAEGIADFESIGSEAFVTGYETGTVMVVAETEDGVRDYIHINIVDC